MQKTKNITVDSILQGAVNLAPLESQKEYRRRMAEFIRMHTARVAALDSGISPSALPHNSMMVIAHTGCGKTYTATRLAEAAGVKLITVDCSGLTRAGFKGCNLGDLLYSVSQSFKNGSEFERAIILFDEVDKMRLDGVDGNPQDNFLKLFDGTIHADPRAGIPTAVDVSRMSFLFAGAFAGLEDIIYRRLTPRSIGFRTDAAREEEVNGDLMARATMEDIRQYGFMEELLGRIGSLCYVPPLTVADYRTLLKGSNGSIAEKYSNLLAPTGVALEITDSACAHIAAEAARSPLGARSADPIVYNMLSGAMSKIDADQSISRVSLTCRDNRLTLRYEHKGRTVEKLKKPPKVCIIAPDVSITEYLDDEDGIETLCALSRMIFNRPDTNEEALLDAFLRCTLMFMSKLKHKPDLVLSSLTKLANTTENGWKNGNSVFDRIMESDLRRYRNEEFGRKLEAAYDRYKDLENENSHEFLVHATKILRQGWYRCLIDEAACA